MSSLGEIEAALAPLTATLDADGYTLAISGSEAAVRLEVVPRVDACVDCLVPSDLFAAIAQSNLASHDLHPELEVVYPADSAAPH